MLQVNYKSPTPIKNVEIKCERTESLSTTTLTLTLDEDGDVKIASDDTESLYLSKINAQELAEGLKTLLGEES